MYFFCQAEDGIRGYNVTAVQTCALPISHPIDERVGAGFTFRVNKYVTVSPNYIHIGMQPFAGRRVWENRLTFPVQLRDRKSTRLNSSHLVISYAVFCLKKKKHNERHDRG